MVIGKLYNGSGLGNMLHRYIATRVLALDKGFDYGMVYIDDGAGKEPGFKGKFFIEQPKLVDYPIGYKVWNEKKVIENGIDIRSYDPEFNFIEDGILIDGEFQDERYWEHREKEVNEWLKVEPLEMPDDLCVIGIRGGEFKLFPDLYLTEDYWLFAIMEMQIKFGNKLRFEIHTDDIEAGEWVSKIANINAKVIHDIGLNWRSMRYAKYAIIANSSFYILPRWLKQHEDKEAITISPHFWARRNTRIWCLPQNFYKCFLYI